MTSDPHISIQHGDETSIEFPSEGVTTSACVAALGDGLYLIGSVPLFVESACFMDIIEADATIDGKLIFKRVAQQSTWRVFEFMLSREIIASGRLEDVLAHADDLGARWERVFGGMLYICVPPDLAWDPTPELVG
jgi:hypothetical protein